MKRRRLTSVLLAAIVSLAAASFTPDEEARLERGEVLITSEDVGRSVPHVRAVAVFKVPPDRLWAVIEDCSHYKDVMPRTLESHELFREGDHVRCREKLDMPYPFSDLWEETDSTSTIEPGVRYVRAWQHHEGDFRVNVGSWTLEARDGGKATLAIYETLSEPSVTLPKFIVTIAQKKTLPEMFERLREKVE